MCPRTTGTPSHGSGSFLKHLNVASAFASRRAAWLLFGALGCFVFARAIAEAPRYKTWDFGPHHELTRALAHALQSGHVPRYLVGVSTGESPYELYPFLTYGIAAVLTLATGNQANAPIVLAIMAVGCHIAIAAFVVHIAAHLAPRPLAYAAGLCAFWDIGSFGSGATMVLEVGLLHGALAQTLALALLDLLLTSEGSPPRWPRIFALWTLAAVSVIAHPSNVLFLAALLLALLLAAALAPPERTSGLLASSLHVGIGALLAAPVWIPFASRVMLHGLHFASPALPLSTALAELLALRWLPTTFPIVSALGYVGVLFGLLRWRSRAFLVALVIAVLLLGATELPNRLYFEWLPLTLARFQPFRLVMLAQPLVFAAAAIPPAALWDWLRRHVSAGRERALGALGFACLLAVCLAWQAPERRTSAEALRALVASEMADKPGFEGLIRWAREQQRAASPERYARLLWDDWENGVYHLKAESGMPGFFVGDGIAMLGLREKIENASAEDLRRFNARWVARRDRPPRLGDPRGERRFGSYFVRELEGWDGLFARVERGEGVARTTLIGDERIEVELGGTTAPALVALGIGYYPRWRAQQADGTPLNVYGLPATANGSARVVAAWLPPGKSIFTADAPLPSDGRGLVVGALALCAAALSLALPGALATGRLRLLPRLLLGGLGAATLASNLAERPVAIALRLVPRAWAEAEVRARLPGGDWRPCAFSRFLRKFECPELGSVTDTTAFLIGDHRASTPFLTPGIVARPGPKRVEFRISMNRRLEGLYWGAGWGPGRSELKCGDEPGLTLRRLRTAAAFHSSDALRCELLLKAVAGGVQGATLVRQDALDVDRTRDVPAPPQEAPASLARPSAR